MSAKLTIGMPTYDDFDGAYFTLQSLRLHHPEVMSEVDLVVADNNPSGPHGAALRTLIADWFGTPSTRYVSVPEAKGPAAVKDRVFLLAETEYVLCMDSHVLLPPGSLKKLIELFRSGWDAGNLLQGPLLTDNLVDVHTHFDDTIWRGGMQGIWATDDRGRSADAEPFEIPAQGMGLFACRRSAWVGFNPKFRGFGGEECYIHEKFRQQGRKTMCLPWLRWLHRFGRPSGVPYRNDFEDRIYNYLIGHRELGLDPKPIADHFKQELGEQGWADVWAKLRPSF